MFALAVLFCGTASGQTFSVLYNFTGGEDGGMPLAGVSRDASGHLYGTTFSGGGGYGTVFRLSQQESGWALTTLHSFSGYRRDGVQPKSKVLIGRDGTLYGTTQAGGSSSCECGTVFSLKPTPQPPWHETLLYEFNEPQGQSPSGDLSERLGNLFGTTIDGGEFSVGVVYELLNDGFGGGGGQSRNYELPYRRRGWTFSDFWTFSPFSGGNQPYGGIAFGPDGNVYGTTAYGGATDNGTVFQLTLDGEHWTENALYSFTNGSDGGHPYTGIAIDSAGNIFGSTGSGGPSNTGTIFELARSGNNWTFSVLYSFGALDGLGTTLISDRAGNLYGTAGNEVFELAFQNGSWVYTDLHDFNGDDGEQPSGSLLLDPSGNIFGTTALGGAYQQGVVFEITP